MLNHQTTLSKSLLSWYEQNARVLAWRKNTEPYPVWVSEIMLQQTRVETVKSYFERFMQTFPEIYDFAASVEDVYLKLWEGLGYYSRIKNMHKSAKIIVHEWGGNFPSNYNDLLSLPGIGPYTAAAIASICFHQPIPAIDGNLLRIFARLNCYEEDIKSSKAKKEAYHFFKDFIPPKNPGIFNQALMDLASIICLSKAEPLCELCPLQDFCLAFKKNLTTQYPKRPVHKKRKIEKKTIVLIHHNQKIILRKREQSGLLAGLYEFPNFKNHLSQNQVLKKTREMGFNPIRIQSLESAKHIFSHLEWHFIAYEIWTDQFEQDNQIIKSSVFSLKEKTDTYKLDHHSFFLSSLKNLADKFPMASAYKFYREYLLKNSLD